MRLLIAGMNYGPEATGIAPYTTDLAEHLARRGHEVVVSTTFPHYPHWRWQANACLRRQVERRNGVEVRRMRVVLPRGAGAGWRVAYDSSLAGVTIANAFGMRPVDLVLCVSPPVQVAFAGALLALGWRAPMLLLVHDLPLDAAISVGRMRPGLAHRAGRQLERRAYALASRVVVIDRRFPNGEFVVLHSGSMGAKQALDSAVRAARLAGEDGSIRLALVGDGPERRGLEALAAERAAGSVRLLPLQPDAVFLRLLAGADAFLLSQRADVVDGIAPSKLLTYMSAGRPVLAAVHPDSAAAHLVREAGCGVVIAPEDPPALADAMRALSRDADRCRALGRAGRRFAEGRFERGGVLARWESLLAGVRRA